MKHGRLSNDPGARLVTITEEDYARLLERQMVDDTAVDEEVATMAKRINPPMLPWVPSWLLYWLPFVLLAALAVAIVGAVVAGYIDDEAKCSRKGGTLVRKTGIGGQYVCVKAEELK